MKTSEIPLKISSAAILLLAKIKEPSPFVSALIQISQGTYVEDLTSDLFESAALEIIAKESIESYAKKKKAGEASAKARLGVKNKPNIKIPDLGGVQIRPISIGTHYVQPDLFLAVSYVFFMRDYSPREVNIFFNDYFFKRNSTDVVTADDILAHAQAWDNYGRESRFADFPVFYSCYRTLIEQASIEELPDLLDGGIGVKKENNTMKIFLTKKVNEIISKNSSLFESIRKECPSIQITFSIIPESLIHYSQSSVL